MALKATGMKLCNRSLFLEPPREVLLICSDRSRLDSSCGMQEYIPKMDLVPTGTSWHMRTESSSDMRSHCTPARTAGKPVEPIGTNQAVQGKVVSTTEETGTSSCQRSPQKCQLLKCYEPKTAPSVKHVQNTRVCLHSGLDVANTTQSKPHGGVYLPLHRKLQVVSVINDYF